MGSAFSKNGGHHNGVMSGHEIMAYAFLSGTQENYVSYKIFQLQV